ncbi:aldo/keto reductase [Actinoplanes sp. TRM88002]|uniref:Aldo/keto reductase n=2 Tax=Paractinoplanes hotanensis TaxID=2906497 RepID=A0ABT0YE60_9ACTN|nr:aldo/keto reductase [Actinoplanes hotanensis]
MNFGDPTWGADVKTSEAIIDHYLDAGGNTLDTANGYAEGRSEETIGGFLTKHPGRRDRVVLATKFAGSMFPGDPNGGGAGRKAIMHQVEASLNRLGTDYIDLYWLHNLDPHTPLEETLGTLDDLVRSGKIRYFGFSDTPAWAVARLVTISELRGWSAVAGIQVEYSLLERSVEGELFAAARALGLGVAPWSPLSGGVLSGKYTRTVHRPADSGRATMSDSQALPESTYVLLDELADIAKEVNTSIASVALAWVRGREEVTSTIIGARTVEQLDANLGSLDVEISAEHRARLDELTTVKLPFPFPLLESTVPLWQHAGATINGVAGPARRC